MERNLCVESGCKAACCFDKQLEYRGIVTDSFPQAKLCSYDEIGEIRIPGVYYTPDNGYIRVRIVGKCPNLGESFDCKIEEVKPDGCRNFAKDKEDCLEVRTKIPKKQDYYTFLGVKFPSVF